MYREQADTKQRETQAQTSDHKVNYRMICGGNELCMLTYRSVQRSHLELRIEILTGLQVSGLIPTYVHVHTLIPLCSLSL